ncbi:MAG: bacteriohemerythrin [Azospirillum sp.]|nr:bacteriohemerythrin [Azospirillum sp.]
MGEALKSVEWTDVLGVGNKTIDDEHKFLFSIYNDLVSALERDETETVVGRVVQELLAYTNYHFGHEEELMSTFEYPDLQAHKKQHDNFIAQLHKIEAHLAAGEWDLVSFAGFVKKWILGHIMVTDTRLGEFLKTRMPANSTGFEFKFDPATGVSP